MRRARLRRERLELALRAALADDQVGAALAQRLAQLAQAAEQERRARPGSRGGRAAARRRARTRARRGRRVRAAAVSAGWSWTRRSRRNQTIAVVGMPGRTGGRARATRRRISAVAPVRDFPLFPLGLVALPSELIPLHIFEERYKTMVARCLEDESRVRDRLDGRRRAAPDRLRVRDRRGPRAAARRAHQPDRARHAAVPDRRAPGRAALPGRASSSSSSTARRTPTPTPPAGAHEAYAELVRQATDRDARRRTTSPT